MNRTVSVRIVPLVALVVIAGCRRTTTEPDPQLETVTVATTSLPTGVVGAAYDATVQASGGDGSYVWEITDGALPAGMVLDSGTGRLSGTPADALDDDVTFRVTSGDGQSATSDLRLVVFEALAITVTSLPLAPGGEPYTSTLSAIGGDGAFSWMVTSGALPTGVTLDAPSGTLSGTPATAGAYAITLQVTSGDGQIETWSTTLFVVEEFAVGALESVRLDDDDAWRDNRVSAYALGSGPSGPAPPVDGFLLFDMSDVPDDSTIVGMELTCALEDAFGSPFDTPVVDIYYSAVDGWTRSTALPGEITLDTRVVSEITFDTYVPTYTFEIDTDARDWTTDLADDRVTFVFRETTGSGYVYFYGPYGSPVGPAPILTVRTIPTP